MPRQRGAIRLDCLKFLTASNGGDRFIFQLEAINFDELRNIAPFCFATSPKVDVLTFN